MPEISVKDQIKKFVELQKIDGEIFELKKHLAEKPVLIAGLQEEFEGSKNKLKAIEEKLKTSQLARRDKELDLKSKEDQISKANAQLMQIKTNKEYTAKLTEIENVKADQSILEEKILQYFDESDDISKEIALEKGNVDEKEKRFQAKKKEVEEEIKGIADRVKVLETQRRQMTEGVDKNLLSRYDRILSHKEGLAIAPVLGQTCGGCYMNVTPQMINRIKMHEELVECEICSRILYLEDDL